MPEFLSTAVVLLDRDGVINENSKSYIKSLRDLDIIESSLDAISELKKNNYLVIVVSNQSAIGRGLTEISDVEEINDAIDEAAQLRGGKIDAFYYCPHTPEDDCDCRKPKPGMLKKIEKDFSINLKGSVFIGDSASDLVLAKNYQMIPVLVRTGNGSDTENMKVAQYAVSVYDNLQHAIRSLVGNGCN